MCDNLERRLVEKIAQKKLYPKIGFKCLLCGRVKIEHSTGMYGFNDTPYVGDLCEKGVKKMMKMNDKQLKELNKIVV